MSTMRTVIVTGASSGMGFGIAKAYLDLGYNVVANSRSMENLKRAAGELGDPEELLLVPGDIGNEQIATKITDEAMKRFGRIDVLINNAGIFQSKPFTDYNADDLEGLLTTNLYGFIHISQLVVPHMIKQGGGHIINITASIALQPLANVPASIPILIKGGLNAVTRALALEYASKGIKVNAVAPGIIKTPMHKPEHYEFLNSLQPMGRIGEVRDVVNAVVNLTDSAFITGAVLEVDGGMAAGRW
jgi:NAD(P)-dependent dehydrogenase (short-subunit alcohol dehydrogenase family)